MAAFFAPKKKGFEMDEENKDLNNSQSVAGSDLNNTQSVAVQDLTQPVTGTQDEILKDGSKKSEKTVKYEEFEKSNTRAKVAEEALLVERQKLAQAIQLQQQTAQTPQVAQVPQPNSTYELAMQQLGLGDEDLYGENIRKVNVRTAELDATVQQQQNIFSANQQFIASHPDFTQVVGSVNHATGQVVSMSQEALILLQKKPYLANASYQSVYDEIQASRKFVELEKVAAASKEHLARQGVNTETDPLGGSAAGGGGAGDTNNQQMMTREQVLDIRKRQANGEQV